MSLRVTSGTLNRSAMAGLQANLARLQRTEEQLSSGRKLNRMSDSPVDAATAMRLRAEQGQTTQVGRNIGDGLSWLGAADSAFTQMSAMILRVRQLLVSGMNATNGAAERSAMASETDELHSALIDQANAQYLGRLVFAGTQNVAAAFEPKTGVYQGNITPIQRNVSTDGSAQLDVTVTGDQAFTTLFSDGPAGAPTAGILSRISAAMSSGDTDAMSVELSKLDAASAAMQGARSLVGARYNRLLRVQSVSEARLDSVTASLSTAESIDLPKTIIDIQTQRIAYQASLGAVAKIIQPSLLDFLR